MYQFIHTENYARSAPKTAKTTNAGKSGKNINYVIAEANREEGAHPHIDAPEPPVLLYGAPLESIGEMVEEWAGSVTDNAGRKLRKDGLCLLAGVISAPNDIPDKNWDKFKNESIEYLLKKYGNCLKSVIEHTDESHPHLHFYVIPEHGQKFDTVHQGRTASAKAKENGELKGEQNRAYKAAMREFQDEFYSAVGMQNGFTRIGPAKRRLTREEWKLEQVQAESFAKAVEKIDEKLEVTKIKAQKIAAQTLKKVDVIEKEAEQKGFNVGLDKVEKMPWFKRLNSVFSRVVIERNDLKNELKTLKAENSEISEKADIFLKRAKKYFKTAKKLDEKIKKIEPIASSAQRHKVEAATLKKEVQELSSALGIASERVQHLETVYLKPENYTRRSRESGLSKGGTLDPALSESRAREARYVAEVEGHGM